jgi:hypothetical protein
VKVSELPAGMPNRSKLWNRLAPLRVPSPSPTSMDGPPRSTLGPMLPSVVTCATAVEDIIAATNPARGNTATGPSPSAETA